MTQHHCDETCVCPTHQTPLMYWLQGEVHACPEMTCAYAHGLENLSQDERTVIAGAQALDVLTRFFDWARALGHDWDDIEADFRSRGLLTTSWP